MRKELLLVHIRKLLICHVRTKCMIWLQTHLFFVTRIVRSYLQHYGYEDTLSAFDMACQSTVPPIYIAQENGFDEQDIVYALNQRKTLRQVWIISPKIPSVLYEGTGELSLDFFFFFFDKSVYNCQKCVFITMFSFIDEKKNKNNEVWWYFIIGCKNTFGPWTSIKVTIYSLNVRVCLE